MKAISSLFHAGYCLAVGYMVMRFYAEIPMFGSITTGYCLGSFTGICTAINLWGARK